jgi:hypothetical protein
VRDLTSFILEARRPPPQRFLEGPHILKLMTAVRYRRLGDGSHALGPGVLIL